MSIFSCVLDSCIDVAHITISTTRPGNGAIAGPNNLPCPDSLTVDEMLGSTLDVNCSLQHVH